MIRCALVVLCLLLAPSLARADQIDAILKYASKSAALSDLAAHTSTSDTDVVDWLMDRAIPDLKVWRNSQDVIGTAPDGSGGTVPTVTHTYLAGYFVLISLPRIVPALRDDAAVQVVIDRNTNAVLRSTVSAGVLQDLRFSPVFAGTNYPFGAWQ